MEIFNSAHDLRVVIRKLDEEILDVRATALEVEDALGRFEVTADGAPALASLVPSTIVIRKRDGSEVRVTSSWGTLTAAGGQARIVVREASISFTEPMKVAV